VVNIVKNRKHLKAITTNLLQGWQLLLIADLLLLVKLVVGGTVGSFSYTASAALILGATLVGIINLIKKKQTGNRTQTVTMTFLALIVMFGLLGGIVQGGRQQENIQMQKTEDTFIKNFDSESYFDGYTEKP